MKDNALLETIHNRKKRVVMSPCNVINHDTPKTENLIFIFQDSLNDKYELRLHSTLPIFMSFLMSVFQSISRKI